MSKLQFYDDSFYLVTVNKQKCNGVKKMVRVTKNYSYFNRYECSLL